MHEFTGGEFIVMGIPGETLDADTAAVIRSIQPSGFILFARNIKSPQQLRNLTDSLRESVKHEPIITIDQEGGRVSRLKEFMTEPPSAKQLSRCGDRTLVETHGRLTGKLLRMFGFNLNLAPVLDIELDEKNDNSLKDRTYGSTAKDVIANAKAFAAGMTAEGILCCGKHFPCDSSASVDPHNALPVVNRSLDEMMALEWVPFRECIPSMDLVMVGHVEYPLIDRSGFPATLSSDMVKRVLRQEMKFGGCTITDDMDMGAIKDTFGTAQAAILSLEAGNDLMLICHSISAVGKIAEALKKVPRNIHTEAYNRILALRERLAPPAPFSQDAFKALDESVKQLRADTLRHSESPVR
jgi:beta-N-acetylhexosaminidase